MTKRFLKTAPIAMLALLAGACTDSLAPLPVPVDRAECARCRMLISGDATGGQIVSASGEPRFYDDIGCLAADAGRLGPNARAYVRTVTGSWTAAENAGYARTGKTATPMGSGIVAFETVDAARASVSVAQALAWPDVVTLQSSEVRR
jgi:hypothetical protein